MPDGLPPAVVEAMARALYEEWPREGPWDQLHQGTRDGWIKRVQIAVGALPACVLIGDGQGNVRQVDLDYVQSLAGAAVLGAIQTREDDTLAFVDRIVRAAYRPLLAALRPEVPDA